MWYKEKENTQELDYNKPIFAEDEGLGVMLLLPQLGTSGYDVKCYNWFRLEDGGYNSCFGFATPQKAVENYHNYKIYNGEIEVKQIART